MYIESVPNRNSPPCILLRQSSRQGKKVIKRTLANLSSWPEPLVEGLRTLLKGGTAVENLAESFEKVRSLPHGHVGAVWGTLRQLGLLALLSRKPGRERQLVAAMVVARILDPGSKLATVRGLDSESQLSTLATVAEIANAQVDGLYAALDWLLARQSRLEKKLARRHLQEGCLVLYDLTSSYFEERRCPLAKLGYSRDGKKGKLQIVIGMLCNRQGCPVAVEAFEGNVADPSTLDSQIEKLQKRFGLRLVVIVGDRGLITSARISEDLQPQGLGWITALRAPQIGKLLDQGHLQLSLFDDRDLAQIRSLDYPGERLIVCRNPLLAEERSRKRRESLAATREQLERIVEAVDRPKRPLRGQDKIGLRVGRVLHRWGMAKHFQLHISKDSFQFQLQGESIDREASLDGIYVIRTSVPEREMEAEQVVDNCGRRTPQVRLHIDHMVPWEKVHRHDPDNLRTACDRCNLGKGAQLLDRAQR